jgi:hypothetical protein
MTAQVEIILKGFNIYDLYDLTSVLTLSPNVNNQYCTQILCVHEHNDHELDSKDC